MQSTEVGPMMTFSSGDMNKAMPMSYAAAPVPMPPSVQAGPGGPTSGMQHGLPIPAAPQGGPQSQSGPHQQGMPTGMPTANMQAGQNAMGQMSVAVPASAAAQGVQWAYCIVPADLSNTLPQGAVPVAHIPATEMGNMSNSGMGFVAGGQMQGGVPTGVASANMDGWHGGRSRAGMAALDQGASRPQGNRPGRGRSPQGRTRNNNHAQQPMQPMQQQQSCGGQAPSNQDWAALGARRAAAPAQANSQQLPPGGGVNRQAPAFDNLQADPAPKSQQMGQQQAPPAMSHLHHQQQVPSQQQQPQQQQQVQQQPAQQSQLPLTQPQQQQTPQQQQQQPSSQQLPASNATEGSGTKEPWKPPHARDGGLRPPAGERRSVERRVSQERRTADRRHSQERRSDRRHSQERRMYDRNTFERKPSKGPYNRGGGNYDRAWGAYNGHEHVAPWRISLPSGTPVMVELVADANSLAKAVGRLNYLTNGEYAAVDCQGQPGEGGMRNGPISISLVQVAFQSATGLECFLFDVYQLGEHVHSIMSFLQNPRIPKIIYDARSIAMGLAYNFNITIAGVVDASCVCDMLGAQKAKSLVDVLDWCQVSSSFIRDEALKVERQPRLWSQRPLPRNLLSYAAHSISMLHSTGPILYARLNQYHGPQGPQLAMTQSLQRVESQSQAGWQLRQQHLQAYMPGMPGMQMSSQPWGQGGEREDPEMDDWLARRMGKSTAGSGQAPLVGSSRRAQSQRAFRAYSQERTLGPRPGDSPRTVEWKQEVAARSARMEATRSQDRDRSNSPSLEAWIDRRAQVKSDEHKKSRRASSAGPAVRSSAYSPVHRPMENSIHYPRHIDGLDEGYGVGVWAEALEEEQAADAEDEDLLRQIDRARETDRMHGGQAASPIQQRQQAPGSG